MSAEDWQKRREQYEAILKREPNRIPIIIWDDSAKRKHQWLIPNEFTFSDVLNTFRKKNQLAANQAIVMLVGNCMIPGNQLMSMVYATHKSPDGFLYMRCTAESTFGRRRSVC